MLRRYDVFKQMSASLSLRLKKEGRIQQIYRKFLLQEQIGTSSPTTSQPGSP
jgi:hypothetical protein